MKMNEHENEMFEVDKYISSDMIISSGQKKMNPCRNDYNKIIAD